MAGDICKTLQGLKTEEQLFNPSSGCVANQQTQLRKLDEMHGQIPRICLGNVWEIFRKIKSMFRICIGPVQTKLGPN